MGKKKILFSILSLKKNDFNYSGGGNYAITLINILEEANYEIIFLYDSLYEIEKDILKVIKFDRKKKIDINEFINSNDLEKYIDDNFKLFFSPVREKFRNFNFKKVKYIYPIHDLRDLELKYNFTSLKYVIGVKKKIKRIIKIIITPFYLKKLKARIFPKKNEIILTVSDYTKYSIKYYFPTINLDSIYVIPPIYHSGSYSEKNIEKKVLREVGVEKENFYFLTNANRWEKNIELFIETYDKLIDTHQLEKKALILGVKKNIFKVKNRDKFIFLDYVDYERLDIFYKNCYAYIYPTLNEGYGLPPVEAMKYGTVIIAAANTAIFEVCENGVIYFKSNSRNELANKILKIEYSKEDYFKMKIKSKERYEILNSTNILIKEKYLQLFERLLNY